MSAYGSYCLTVRAHSSADQTEHPVQAWHESVDKGQRLG